MGEGLYPVMRKEGLKRQEKYKTLHFYFIANNSHKIYAPKHMKICCMKILKALKITFSKNIFTDERKTFIRGNKTVCLGEIMSGSQKEKKRVRVCIQESDCARVQI